MASRLYATRHLLSGRLAHPHDLAPADSAGGEAPARAVACKQQRIYKAWAVD